MTSLSMPSSLLPGVAGEGLRKPRTSALIFFVTSLPLRLSLSIAANG